MFERLFDINDTTGATKTDIQWGWSVNEDQQPDKDLPLLFYPIRITSTSNPISFRESASSTDSLSIYLFRHHHHDHDSGTTPSRIVSGKSRGKKCPSNMPVPANIPQVHDPNST